MCLSHAGLSRSKLSFRSGGKDSQNSPCCERLAILVLLCIIGMVVKSRGYERVPDMALTLREDRSLYSVIKVGLLSFKGPKGAALRYPIQQVVQ